MRRLIIALALAALAGPVAAQTGICSVTPAQVPSGTIARADFNLVAQASLDVCGAEALDLSVTGDWDFLTASLGIPSGATNPATCTEGDVFWDTDDDELNLCSATDTWSPITGGGASVTTITDDASCDPNQVIARNAGDTAFECQTSSGGAAITLDIGDDGGNDSTDLQEIATSGDTNSVITESDADKLLIDFTANWPSADTADALSANGGNCTTGNYPLGVDAAGAVESCTADDDVPESGDFGAAGDLEADGTLSADVVAAAEMADADHGDVSWSSGVATVDSGAVGITELADDATCAANEVVARNAGDTAFECQATGGGAALQVDESDGTPSVSNVTEINFDQAQGLTVTDDTGGSVTIAVDESVLDHGTLAGTGDDDHTQYALLAGRATGQALIGGTASGDDLTLQSTSNATKGSILFGTSAYDEVNDRLGIGTAAPTTKAHVLSAAAAITILTVENSNVTSQNTSLRLTNSSQLWEFRNQSNGVFTFLDSTNSLQPLVIQSGTPTNSLEILNSSLVINEGGNSYDTRIEGDTDANLLVADASTDRVGIGTATPAAKLDVNGTAQIGLIRSGVQDVTCTNDGTGSPQALQITPTHSLVRVTNQDTNGCNLTMSEGSAVAGDIVVVLWFVQSAAGSVVIGDSSGVWNTAGGMTMGTADSLTSIYTGTQWVEIARSDV